MRSKQYRCIWSIFLAIFVLAQGQENARREQPPQTTTDGSLCRMEMKGVEATRTLSASINVVLECEGDALFEKSFPVDSIEETEIPKGLRLFVETEDGLAFLHVDPDSNVNLAKSAFLNLPAIGSTQLAAPLVVSDQSIKITNTVFQGNAAGFKVGALLIKGNAIVDLFNVSFYDNISEEGTLLATGSSNVEIDYCDFDGNNGTQVGAIKLIDNPVVMVSETLFERNVGKEEANVFFITDKAVCVIDESSVYGDEAQPDFEAFLRDPSRPDNSIEKFDLPVAAVARISGKASVIFIDCLISGHSGKYGAIYVTGSPSVEARFNDFEDNRGLTGGGLFVNGERATYVRVLNCSFRRNVARYGGGLVMAGNGTYTIDTCNFINNAALDGGAIWGDYSEENTCPRASSGSRLTILDSRFEKNVADRSGGAFYIQCTDMFATNSTFEKNEAVLGDGGFIYAGNTFNLLFDNCSISDNRAGGSGGAIYVNGSNDIEAKDCKVENNQAGKDGGAILSLNGHGILFYQSTLKGSQSGANGGAIFASNVEVVDFIETPISDNKAGGAGGVFSGDNIGNFTWRDLNVKNNQGDQFGAVAIDGGNHVLLQNISFLENKAKTSYGAVQLAKCKNVSLNFVNFAENVASDLCGALSIENASNFETVQTKFESNSAGTGGGLCIEGSNSIKLSDTYWLSNLATNGNGGGLHITKSDKLSLENVTLIHNNATESGGALFLEDVKTAKIGISQIMNSTAGFSAGCLYAASVGSFDMELITLRHCEATNGGAAIFTGVSRINGRRINFEYNAASNDGGAFLCNQQTEIGFKESLFYYNAAPDGSTLLTDCNCKVDISDSQIYRDDQRSNNGDFFKVNRGCSELVTLRNNMFGGLVSNSQFEWYEYTGMGVGAFLVVLIFLCCCYFCLRKRKAAKKSKKDVENPSKEEDDDDEYTTETESEGEASEDEEGSESEKNSK